MKKYTFFTTLFLMLSPFFLLSQGGGCDALIEESRQLIRKEKFNDAIKKVEAAKGCASQSEIDKLYLEIFNGLKKQTTDAENARDEARRQRNAATVEREKAEKRARENYANDLAYKSQTALRSGDRSAAFQLVEFACRYADSDNPNVTNALVQALYYNENPNHPPLPWAWSLEGHTSTVVSVAFSPDGKKLATGSHDRTVKIWDVESGQTLLTISSGHSYRINMIAFSPDGKKLVTGSDDKTAKIWDTKSGKELITLNGSYRINSVAFSPDGKKLAIGEGEVQILDAESSKKLLTLNKHNIDCIVAFSPDGKKLATNSKDRTVIIWDVESGKEVMTLNTGGITSIAFSPDGKKLATGCHDRTVKIWEVESGVALLTLSGYTYAVDVAFSPDGKKLATSSSSTGSIAFSPDGENIATVGGLMVKIWDLKSDKELMTIAKYNGVKIVAYSPDGKKLATGSEDKTAKIWDLKSGKELLTLSGHTERIRSIAFSPDGKKFATGSEDKTVKIWDTKSGKELMTLSRHTSPVYSIAFSPDGGKLATSGSFDRTIKIWNVKLGKVLLILTLSEFENAIYCVAFSPDGKKLVAGLRDSTAKMWDLESGKELLTISGHIISVMSVTFSPDGKKLATGSWDGTVKIWDLTLEGWYFSPLRKRQIAGLTAAQLDAYNLSGLLDIRPQNEQILLGTNNTWQIAAFADLYSNKIRQAGVPKKEDYERALRLYDYCVKSGEAPEYFAQQVEELKKVWKEKTE